MMHPSKIEYVSYVMNASEKQTMEQVVKEHFRSVENFVKGLKCNQVKIITTVEVDGKL